MTKPCELDVCTCEVDAVDHCGPTCRMGIVDNSGGDPCKCGHAVCRSTVGQASAPD